MRTALIVALSTGLLAQQPKSYIGTSNNWSPFNEDKAMHFLVGGLIGIAPALTSRKIGNNAIWLDSLFWALLAGVIKENYDKNHGGRREYADVAYTGLGGFTVGFMIHLGDKRKERLYYAQAPKLIPEPIAGGQ